MSELEAIAREERETAKNIMRRGTFFLVAYDFPDKPPQSFYTAYHGLRKYYPSDIARIQYSVAVTSTEDLATTLADVVQQLGGFVIIAIAKVKEIRMPRIRY